MDSLKVDNAFNNESINSNKTETENTILDSIDSLGMVLDGMERNSKSNLKMDDIDNCTYKEGGQFPDSLKGRIGIVVNLLEDKFGIVAVALSLDTTVKILFDSCDFQNSNSADEKTISGFVKVGDHVKIHAIKVSDDIIIEDNSRSVVYLATEVITAIDLQTLVKAPIKSQINRVKDIAEKKLINYIQVLNFLSKINISQSELENTEMAKSLFVKQIVGRHAPHLIADDKSLVIKLEGLPNSRIENIEIDEIQTDKTPNIACIKIDEDYAEMIEEGEILDTTIEIDSDEYSVLGVHNQNDKKCELSKKQHSSDKITNHSSFKFNKQNIKTTNKERKREVGRNHDKNSRSGNQRRPRDESYERNGMLAQSSSKSIRKDSVLHFSSARYEDRRHSDSNSSVRRHQNERVLETDDNYSVRYEKRRHGDGNRTDRNDMRGEREEQDRFKLERERAVRDEGREKLRMADKPHKRQRKEQEKRLGYKKRATNNKYPFFYDHKRSYRGEYSPRSRKSYHENRSSREKYIPRSRKSKHENISYKEKYISKGGRRR